MSGTASFFHSMAPVLTANILTVAFVYAFAKIHQKERSGEEEGRGTYLWLIVLVFLFMLYGLHTWGAFTPSRISTPLRSSPQGQLHDPPNQARGTAVYALSAQACFQLRNSEGVIR
jgi:hypothetical protein